VADQEVSDGRANQGQSDQQQQPDAAVALAAVERDQLARLRVAQSLVQVLRRHASIPILRTQRNTPLSASTRPASARGYFVARMTLAKAKGNAGKVIPDIRPPSRASSGLRPFPHSRFSAKDRAAAAVRGPRVRGWRTKAPPFFMP